MVRGLAKSNFDKESPGRSQVVCKLPNRREEKRREERIHMAQSPYPQQLTLSQCLDNLRNASLHVLQHKHVSDDAKSFI